MSTSLTRVLAPSAFAAALFEGACLCKQTFNGFTGKEFSPFGCVIATANPPDGKQAGDFGWRQIFRQHVQTFLHGLLFGFDNDAHGCSLVKIRINSGGVNARIEPRYLRINWSSQVMKKSALALSAAARCAASRGFRPAFESAFARCSISLVVRTE